jgi:hypothetical protein
MGHSGSAHPKPGNHAGRDTSSGADQRPQAGPRAGEHHPPSSSMPLVVGHQPGTFVLIKVRPQSTEPPPATVRSARQIATKVHRTNSVRALPATRQSHAWDTKIVLSLWPGSPGPAALCTRRSTPGSTGPIGPHPPRLLLIHAVVAGPHAVSRGRHFDHLHRRACAWAWPAPRAAHRQPLPAVSALVSLCRPPAAAARSR